MKRLLAVTLLLVSCGTAGAEVGTVGPVPTTTPATTTTTVLEPVALGPPVEPPVTAAPLTPYVPSPVLPGGEEPPADAPALELPSGLPLCSVDASGDCDSPIPTMEQILAGENEGAPTSAG